MDEGPSCSPNRFGRSSRTCLRLLEGLQVDVVVQVRQRLFLVESLVQTRIERRVQAAVSRGSGAARDDSNAQIIEKVKVFRARKHIRRVMYGCNPLLGAQLGR